MLQKRKQGGNIMLGGIVFQLVAIVAYVILASEFLLRYYHDSPVRYSYSATVTDKDGNAAKVAGEEGRRGKVDRKMKMMLLGMVGMTVCLFIR